jgi:hypothetical protein
VTLLAGSAAAQYTVWSGTTRGFQSSVSPRLLVRDQGGDLYALYRYQPTSLTDWRLGIAQSKDGGKNWNLGWQTGFDTNPSGHSGNIPNGLAIDSQGNLHVTWYHQQTNYRSTSPRYNRWDKGTNSWGTEVTFAGIGYGRSAGAVAVDSKDHVWVVHGTTSSWYGQVVRSDKPTASDMKFSPTTPAFPAQTMQHASLAVDSLDRIHVSFYSTKNGATVHHMWLDPAASTPAWSSATPLGNNNATADYYSSIVADGVGNMYIVYGVDVQSGKTQDPFWELRKWDGSTQTWGSPVMIYKTTRAQYKDSYGENDGRVICAACDETSGELYFTYRNYESGKFLLGRWADGDANPTTFAVLGDTGKLPPNSRNYMFYPNFRGTVTPAFNQTSVGLDLFYVLGDQNVTKVYTWYCDPFPIGSLTPAPSSTPRIGTTFKMDLTAWQDGGQAYATALSVGGLGTFIQPDRRIIPLVPDTFFYITVLNAVPSVFQNFSGVLGSQGTAQAGVAIPNVGGLVGVKAYTAYVTYPGGPGGIKTISNPLTFSIIQ